MKRLPGRLDVLQGRDVSCTGEIDVGSSNAKQKLDEKDKKRRKTWKERRGGQWGQERKMLYTDSQKKSLDMKPDISLCGGSSQCRLPGLNPPPTHTQGSLT